MPRKRQEWLCSEFGNIHSFAEVDRLLYLKDGRWRAQRRVNGTTHHNRRLVRNDQGISLHTFGEPLMTWDQTNMVTIDTHAGYTVTTRQDISAWLPDNLEVYELSGYWYVKLPLGDRPFHDGMVLDLETRTEFGPAFDIDEAIAWNREWEPKINRYVQNWRRKVEVVGGIGPAPDDLRQDDTSWAAMWVEENLDPKYIYYFVIRHICAARGKPATIVDWFLKRHILKGAYTGRRRSLD